MAAYHLSYFENSIMIQQISLAYLQNY